MDVNKTIVCCFIILSIYTCSGKKKESKITPNEITSKQTVCLQNDIKREWSFLRNINIFLIFHLVLSIRCYQCSSQQDRKGHDSCGAYKRFNKTQHIAIECNSDESHMPGSFCMKVVQQGPRGFICKLVCLFREIHLMSLTWNVYWLGDGRWRQVIRRCASVAETGVTGVCNWGVYENGVYWEECYCAHDACNGSNDMQISVGLMTGLLVMTTYLFSKK